VSALADDPRSMRERMLAGDLYLADDPELIEAADRAHDLAAAYNATTSRQRPLRRRLLEELSVDYGSGISIGDRTFVNVGLVALDVAPISIGADVMIGPNVQLLTPTHPVDPDLRRAKWEAARPIVIGDNVWLGGGVVVCPGVTIGADTVVGAGSVVTRDLPPRVVAVGNPARVVRAVDDTGVEAIREQ
jgi:maltose O-acetyltransferase